MSLGHFDVLPTTPAHVHIDDFVALPSIGHVKTYVDLCHDIPTDSFFISFCLLFLWLFIM